jgi:AraC-like DNA-binding protein
MKPDVTQPTVPARLQQMHLYAVLFLAGILLFCVRKLGDIPPGQWNNLLTVASCATCGWSWLLTRALFRDGGGRDSPWPLLVVLVLTATGALLQFSGDDPGWLVAMAGNLQRLVSSTVLLVALAEPLRTWRPAMPGHELPFRLAFVGAYAALVAVSSVWLGQSEAGNSAARVADEIKVACALVAVLVLGLAIRFRSLHPLAAPPAAKPRVAAAGEHALAVRIEQLMTAECLHAEANLKVADLAIRLGVADYKVTQCITGAMGFRNFNQMVNHWRVQQAKRMLADARFDGLPVLSIALDCGFGSIGPFNRAFKVQTGMTPTHYRANAAGAGQVQTAPLATSSQNSRVSRNASSA